MKPRHLKDEPGTHSQDTWMRKQNIPEPSEKSPFDSYHRRYVHCGVKFLHRELKNATASNIKHSCHIQVHKCCCVLKYDRVLFITGLACLRKFLFPFGNVSTKVLLSSAKYQPFWTHRAVEGLQWCKIVFEKSILSLILNSWWRSRLHSNVHEEERLCVHLIPQYSYYKQISSWWTPC